MAGSWTADRFPQFEADIRRLAEQHRELEDEPLHLAISYLPPVRDQQDIFLFEVISGSSEVNSPERDLFEATFTATPGFPMAPGQQLHLIMTSPGELKKSLQEGWERAWEVVRAIRFKDYQVLHSDDVGRKALAMLQAAAQQEEAVRG